MDAEQRKKCNDILDYFLKSESTVPFRERVNWEEWGLYDYLQVVKVPMDLGTIREKLSQGEYKKNTEFVRDMRLVWDNCKLYNQDGSELYLLADELSKRFEDKIRSVRLDSTRSDRSTPGPTLEEKLVLSQNIYKVASKELGSIVSMLEENCPKSLDKASPDEIDIVVDAIDHKTFREIENLVNESVPEDSRQTVANLKASRKSKRSKESASSSKKSKVSE